MAKRTRALARHHSQSPQSEATDDDKDAITSEIILSPTTSVSLINAEIVQILIKHENSAEEIRRLMDADLTYNKQRLEIIREHAAQHPDAIDGRKAKQSRRNQYSVLLGLACILLFTMPFVSLAVAAINGTIGTLIVCGILVNARERELDLQGFLKLINVVVGKEK